MKKSRAKRQEKQKRKEARIKRNKSNKRQNNMANGSVKIKIPQEFARKKPKILPKLRKGFTLKTRV